MADIGKLKDVARECGATVEAWPGSIVISLGMAKVRVSSRHGRIRMRCAIDTGDADAASWLLHAILYRAGQIGGGST